MSALQIALREVRKLQEDEIARGQIHFAPPTDEDELLSFWSRRITGSLNSPRGMSPRYKRVLGLLFAAVESGELEWAR